MHGGGGREGHDPEKRGGGRRGRLFDGAALRLMTLSLIAAEPRHGYDLIRVLAERSGGGWSPSPGQIYPLLTMLTDMGLIREEEAQSGSRKRYAITAEGQTELDGASEETARLFDRLDALASEAARVDPAPVRRAMHNLRAVLMNRLQAADATPETVFEAVALIDGAAQAIERL